MEGWDILGWMIVCLLVGKAILGVPRDDTDSPNKRSGMGLYTDHKTGLQYLRAGWFGGLTPRLDANGKHMRASD